MRLMEMLSAEAAVREQIETGSQVDLATAFQLVRICLTSGRATANQQP